VPQNPSLKRARAIGRDVLLWYAKHRRNLPWRRSLDPYAVWVSEMMLSTNSGRDGHPLLRALDEALPRCGGPRQSRRRRRCSTLGKGLLLLARTQLAASRRANRAASPRPRAGSGDRAASAAGIGPYSAGAIASIAYGQPEPLVDGNVVRVLARLFALRGDPNRAPLKAELWELARSLVPQDSPVISTKR